MKNRSKKRETLNREFFFSRAKLEHVEEDDFTKQVMIQRGQHDVRYFLER